MLCPGVQPVAILQPVLLAKPYDFHPVSVDGCTCRLLFLMDEWPRLLVIMQECNCFLCLCELHADVVN